MTHLLLALALLADAAAVKAPAATPATATPPQGTHFVFLVRHGAYDRDDQADERTANPLNALGHEQAKLLGARLAAAPVSFRTFAASDFTRARQTAEDLGAALRLAPAPEPLLRECTPTKDHPEYSTPYSAEHIAECGEQLEAAFRKYLVPTPAADTWDLLVCHGNVIRWLVAKATGNDVRRWYANDIANASLTAIAVRPDGSMRLVLYSDVGHLPPEKQTWAGRGLGFGRPKAPAPADPTKPASR